MSDTTGLRRENALRTIGGRLSRSHESYLFLLIIAYCLIVNNVNSSFLTVENIFDVLKSSSIMGTMAIGVFVVMLSGGMDISFTAIATVSMFVTVRILLLFTGNLAVAFGLAGVIGMVMGSINAVLVHFCRLPTLIVTLGTSSIFHGGMLALARIPYIYTVPRYFSGFSKQMLFSWKTAAGSTVGLSMMTVIVLGVALLTWALLRYSSLGRGIYALGGNPEAAKRAGFNIMRTQFFVYCYVGLLSGVASMEYVSLVRHVHPFNLMDIMLDVIAAVVLGGTSLAGGRGTVWGTLLGVWMIYLIRNSLVLMRIPSYWDSVVIGLVIVVSTGINAYGRVLSRSGRKAIDA
jgi:simple sugar transport system permease protein